MTSTACKPGPGTRLAEAAVAHVAPYGLSRLLLSTIDAHEVYARAGFVALPHPEKLMILAPGGGPAEELRTSSGRTSASRNS